jgi:membrane-bound lytic murein transglycosylase A
MLLLSLAVGGCQLLAPAPSGQPILRARYHAVEFDRLPALGDQDLGAAWPAWLASCSAFAWPDPASSRTRRSVWLDACAHAAAVDGQDATAIRAFLQAHFQAYRVEALSLDPDRLDSGPVQRSLHGLATGYYEAQLQGSRTLDARFSVPLYRVPGDLVRIELSQEYPQLRGLTLRGRLDPSATGLRVVPYWSREDLATAAPLRGAELVWVDDPLQAFFLQVQGSGRVQLTDGSQIRVAYADTNGHPYRSIGRWLVEHGELSVEQATMQGIRDWAAAHPERLSELLNQNPSVVFFRELALNDPDQGPAGALGVPLTAGYSVAVDPRFVPLGGPLVIDTEHPVTGEPLSRLMLAQDTGGAIRGPLRLDLFWGLGPAAEAAAGRQRGQASVWLLVPKGQSPEGLVAP